MEAYTLMPNWRLVWIWPENARYTGEEAFKNIIFDDCYCLLFLNGVLWEKRTAFAARGQRLWSVKRVKSTRIYVTACVINLPQWVTLRSVAPWVVFAMLPLLDATGGRQVPAAGRGGPWWCWVTTGPSSPPASSTQLPAHKRLQSETRCLG